MSTEIPVSPRTLAAAVGIMLACAAFALIQGNWFGVASAGVAALYLTGLCELERSHRRTMALTAWELSEASEGGQ